MSINVFDLGFVPTRSELQTAREVWARTPDVNIKTLLSQFSTECPVCKRGPDHWKLLPPIKPSGKYHFVKYLCECGACFKKIEEAE